MADRQLTRPNGPGSIARRRPGAHFDERPVAMAQERSVGELVGALSSDLSLRQPIELADGSTITAIEMQWEFFDRAKKYA